MEETLEFKPPKGTKDYIPLEMYKKEKVIDIALQLVRESGALPIDTPVFEIRDLLKKENVGVKLIFDLKDNYKTDSLIDEEEKKEVYSLRYDQTVPFSRYIKSNGVKKLKRYQVGKVYRRDQPNFKLGRFREFTQLDFDIFGDEFDVLYADSETLVLLSRILSALNIEFVIRVNDRRLLEKVFIMRGAPSDLFKTICSSIDKLDKLKPNKIIQEMIEKGLDPQVASDLMNTVRTGKLDELDFPQLESTIELVGELLNVYGIKSSLKFDLSLARGLDYYTGLIFEVVLKKKKSKIGSIAGGGRYDELCGARCVGFSLGIDRLCTVIGNVKKGERSPQIWIVQPGNDEQCFLKERMMLVAKYRNAGIFADTELREKTGVKLQMRFALKNEVPFVVFLGQNEVKQKMISLRIMDLRTQTMMTFEESLLAMKLQQQKKI